MSTELFAIDESGSVFTGNLRMAHLFGLPEGTEMFIDCELINSRFEGRFVSTSILVMKAIHIEYQGLSLENVHGDYVRTGLKILRFTNEELNHMFETAEDNGEYFDWCTDVIRFVFLHAYLSQDFCVMFDLNINSESA
jgi:hypothetical protein